MSAPQSKAKPGGVMKRTLRSEKFISRGLVEHNGLRACLRIQPPLSLFNGKYFPNALTHLHQAIWYLPALVNIAVMMMMKQGIKNNIFIFLQLFFRSAKNSRDRFSSTFFYFYFFRNKFSSTKRYKNKPNVKRFFFSPLQLKFNNILQWNPLLL